MSAANSVLITGASSGIGEALAVEGLAKALKRDRADVADAMVFWQQQGILLPAGESASEKARV